MDKTLILDHQQTMQKIRRIAFEIYEQNFQEEEIIFAGIYDRGYEFAKLLQEELEAISPIKTKLVQVSVDKSSPMQSDIDLDISSEELQGKTVIITDDVLNSGRTLAYSLKPFLKCALNRLQIAVIVERSYRQFPVAADYVGYALSTTVQEHIQVTLDEENSSVYLN